MITTTAATATNPSQISLRVALGFHSHASVILIIGAVAAFHWWAFTRLGPTLVEPGQRPYSVRQRNWIIAGIAWTFAFSYWPLHDIAERYLFFVHMLQHTVFTMFAPACILLSWPQWLWTWMRRRPVIGTVMRVFSRPLISLVMFNAMVAGTHWSGIVERSLHNEMFHFGIHFALFTGATLMWMPVINRDPALPRLSEPAKMMYLFAQSIVPTVPASFLAMSKKVLYPTYSLAPRLIHGFSAISDQQIAAAIMKVGVGFYLWVVIAVLYFRWWQQSDRGLANDNRFAVPTAPARVAGMTVSGRRFDEAVVAEEVLTWDKVKSEFARIDAPLTSN